MSSSLDMSLDDLVKSNKKFTGGSGSGNGNGNFRGRGRSFAPGPTRRFPSRSVNRPSPYSSMGRAPDSAWQHDRYSNQMSAFPAVPAARSSAIETGTKIYVSNLDYGVSNEDIKELFSEVGDLKHYSVHYDRSGRSKGTAEVVFSRMGDALAAMKRYNNVQLDGKPMKLEVVGTNIVTPAAVPRVSDRLFRNPNNIPKSGPGRGGSVGWPRGGGRGLGRGRGRGRGRGEPVSVEDLDADLRKYHTEAMQIN